MTTKTLRMMGRWQDSVEKTSAIMTSLPYLEEMECSICLLQHPSSEFVSLLKCRCVFCACCLEQYLTIAILEAKVECLPCPSPTCSRAGRFIGKEISALVRPEIFLQFLFLKQTFDVEKDPFRVMCPIEDCQAICHLCSGTGDTYSESQGQPVNCYQCGTVFCSKCKALWHKNMPCDRLVEQWRRQNDVCYSSFSSGESTQLLGASSSSTSLPTSSVVVPEKALSMVPSAHSALTSAEAIFTSRRKNSMANSISLTRGPFEGERGVAFTSSFHELIPKTTTTTTTTTTRAKTSDSNRQKGSDNEVKSKRGLPIEDESKRIRGAGILADINVKQCSNCLLLLEPRESSFEKEILTICHRCRHVFCSFCRHDISPDFMLRHFDEGECRERWLSLCPSTSKAALIWNRTQSFVIKGLNNFFTSPLRGASLIKDFLNKPKPPSKSSFYETLDAYIEQELQWLVDSFFWKLKTRVLVMDLSQIHCRVIRSLLFNHGKYLIYSDSPRQRRCDQRGSKRDLHHDESCEDLDLRDLEETESGDNRLLRQECSHRDCVILSWISLLDEWTLLPDNGSHQGLGFLANSLSLDGLSADVNYNRQEEKLRIAKIVKFFEDFGVIVLAELKKRRLVLKKDHNVIKVRVSAKKQMDRRGLKQLREKVDHHSQGINDGLHLNQPSSVEMEQYLDLFYGNISLNTDGNSYRKCEGCGARYKMFSYLDQADVEELRPPSYKKAPVFQPILSDEEILDDDEKDPTGQKPEPRKRNFDLRSSSANFDLTRVGEKSSENSFLPFRSRKIRISDEPEKELWKRKKIDENGLPNSTSRREAKGEEDEDDDDIETVFEGNQRWQHWEQAEEEEHANDADFEDDGSLSCRSESWGSEKRPTDLFASNFASAPINGNTNSTNQQSDSQIQSDIAEGQTETEQLTPVTSCLTMGEITPATSGLLVEDLTSVNSGLTISELTNPGASSIAVSGVTSGVTFGTTRHGEDSSTGLTASSSTMTFSLTADDGDDAENDYDDVAHDADDADDDDADDADDENMKRMRKDKRDNSENEKTTTEKKMSRKGRKGNTRGGEKGSEKSATLTRTRKTRNSFEHEEESGPFQPSIKLLDYVALGCESESIKSGAGAS